MRQIHGAIYIYITMFFVAVSYGLGHVYSHPILTFLSGACMHVCASCPPFLGLDREISIKY